MMQIERVKLDVDELELWDSGLAEKLCSIDGFVGCHSEDMHGYARALETVKKGV